MTQNEHWARGVGDAVQFLQQSFMNPGDGNHGNLAESSCRKDKHKAPTRPHIHPLSLQGESDPFPFIPYSVGKHHQDDGDASVPVNATH